MAFSKAPVPSPVGASSMAHAGDDIRDAIRRRSVFLHARLRVTDAIHALALDIVGDDESLSPTDRALLRRHVASAVTEATEEALAVLTQELARAIGSAPPRLRPAIARRPAIRRIDFE